MNVAFKIKLASGYTIIKFNQEVLKKLIANGLFGDICDSCNQLMKDDVYYIPVLNQGMCQECMEEWDSSARLYESDLFNEIQNLMNFEKNLKKLNIQVICENDDRTEETHYKLLKMLNHKKELISSKCNDLEIINSISDLIELVESRKIEEDIAVWEYTRIIQDYQLWLLKN